MTHVFVLTRLYHVHQPLNYLLFIQPLQLETNKRGRSKNECWVAR